MKRIGSVLLLVLAITSSTQIIAQNISLFQSDFSWQEFKDRRNKIFSVIGPEAMAVIQSGATGRGFEVFRQNNDFYYLCGLETETSYLLLDGRNKTTTLFLTHRDADRESGEGKSLSSEDAELIISTTGIDAVLPLEQLSKQLAGPIIRRPFPTLYTIMSPGEGRTTSRDEIMYGLARAISNPWEEASTREAQFVELIQQRFPQYELKDLSPTLDDMRLIKSPAEINLIRRASQIAGLGLIEAMKSTESGLYEYQLAAAARYIFLLNGCRYEGYDPIVGGGTNAWYGHYFHNNAELKSGDMVLMDYAPDYHYYTSDVTRMWPVNGKFTTGQKELYGFIIEYYKELVKRIRPGVSYNTITDETIEALKPVLARTKFSKDIYKKAAEGALTFRHPLSHPVGMAVHDVGNYKNMIIKPGTVFSVDPMIWVPEEKLYVRIEDVGVVTETGFENFSAFVPFEIDEIEKLMKETGVLQKVPATSVLK